MQTVLPPSRICIYARVYASIHNMNYTWLGGSRHLSSESCESCFLGSISVRLRYETANLKYPLIEAWEIQPFHLFLATHFGQLLV